MADDTNEDSWLYGSSNPDSTTNEEDKAESQTSQLLPPSTDSVQEGSATETTETSAVDSTEKQPSPDSNNRNGDDVEIRNDEVEFEEDPAHEMEEDDNPPDAGIADSDANKDPGYSDEDDSDDDINVVIGDIKSAPSTTYNIKQRGNLLTSTGGTAAQDKVKQSQGKFNIEEFETVGTINSIPAHEFNLETLEEDKPWRKPGADITDYFNYGFNEDTWRAYCERQKKFRLNESGVGLSSLTAPIQSTASAMPNPAGANMQMNRNMMPMNNGDMKYGLLQKRPIPTMGPPGSKENVIQVMTAECREYSRTGGLPPPMGGIPIPGFPLPGQPDFFQEPELYDYGYEPSQESQWMNDNPNSNPNWVPTGIKELTPGTPPIVPPPMQMRPPMMGMGPPGIMPPSGAMNMGQMPPRMIHPHGMPAERDRSERERDRDRDRDREGRGDRDRERSDRDRDRERKRRDRDRDYDRRDRDRDREDRGDRDRDRDREERAERERDREREERGERDRERDDRERTSRRERSRSKERSSRRRSKSRDRESERKTRDKKKSSSSSHREKIKDVKEIKEEPADN